jgi:hypothetical protein
VPKVEKQRLKAKGSFELKSKTKVQGTEEKQL